jgi:hypothetical protein
VSRSYRSLVCDGLFDRRVAVRLLEVALSSTDTVQQRVRIQLVAMIDLGKLFDPHEQRKEQGSANACSDLRHKLNAKY